MRSGRFNRLSSGRPSVTHAAPSLLERIVQGPIPACAMMSIMPNRTRVLDGTQCGRTWASHPVALAATRSPAETAVTGPVECIASNKDDRYASMEAELVVLRAENARLRGLLGLDVRSARQPTTAWTPTLFAGDESAAPVAIKIDGSSSTVEKIVLFASLFSGREDVYALEMGERADRQVGLGSGGAGRVVEFTETGPGVPAVHRRGDREAPLGGDPRRSVPAAPWRHLPSVGVRLRRARVGPRRARLS